MISQMPLPNIHTIVLQGRPISSSTPRMHPANHNAPIALVADQNSSPFGRVTVRSVRSESCGEYDYWFRWSITQIKSTKLGLLVELTRFFPAKLYFRPRSTCNYETLSEPHERHIERQSYGLRDSEPLYGLEPSPH